MNVSVQQIARARAVQKRAKGLKAAVGEVVQVPIPTCGRVRHDHVNPAHRVGEKCHAGRTPSHLCLAEAVDLVVVANRPTQPHDAKAVELADGAIDVDASLGCVALVGSVMVARHVQERHVGERHDVLEIGRGQVPA